MPNGAPYSFEPDLRPAETVAELAPLTYLSNLEIDDAGTIYVTSALDGRLWSVPFGGEPRPLAQIEGRPSSIAAAPDGGWLIFGSKLDGAAAVFEVEPGGTARSILDLPECILPNGVQRFPDGRYLLADSVTATIWDIDYARRSCSAWLRHPVLAPVEGSPIPGVNGLKMFDGSLYMTNTGHHSIISVAVEDGRPAGEPTIVTDDVPGDDFAFDVEGAMYVTTHPHNAVVRRRTTGELTMLAGVEQGVKGCTSCRFGRRPGDETGLYVAADGGLFNPNPGGLEPARLVRVETGVAGAPVDLV